MTLSTNLRDSFGEDDDGNSFDLSAILNAVVVVTQRIGPVLGGDFDLGAITGAVQTVTGRVGAADTAGVAASAQQAGAQAAEQIAALAGAETILRPVLGLVETIEGIASGEAGAMLTSLRDAAIGGAADGGLGVAGVSSSLGAVFRGLRAETPTGAVLQRLIGLVPGAGPIDSTIDTAATAGAGIHELIAMLGGLMSVRTIADEIELATTRVSGFLDERAARDALASARSLSRRAAEIAELVAAVPASGDGPVADAASARVEELVLAFHALADVLVAGMARGEATLVDAGVRVLADELGAAERSLGETAGREIRLFAIDLQARARAVLPAPAGPQPSSLDELWTSAEGMVGTLVELVNGIPVERVTAPVAGAIGKVTGVVAELNRVLAQVQGAIRGVFEQARQLVQTIDTRALTEAIGRFMRPIVEAVTQLEQVLTTAMQAIGAAVAVVTGKIADVEAELTGAAGLVTGAFQRIATLIDDLHIEDLVEEVRGKVREAAAALDRVQLSPYFDTAIEAMDTTASIVDAIPFGLLPDAELRKLGDLARPIKELDFDGQVRQVLHTQLTAILDELDNNILGEVQDAFNQVADFLTEIDPRAALTGFERDHYDPLLARLRALDPDELLRPVTEAIDRVRAQIAGLDLRGEILGAIERVFDDLLARFDQLNPAALLAPIEQRVDAAKDQVMSIIQLDRWLEHIDLLSSTANGWLDRIDLAAAAERLEAIHDQWLAAAQGAGGAVIGGIVATMASGSGSRVRAGAYPAVARWISGDDGAAEVRASVTASRARLDATRALGGELDLATLGGELTQAHRLVADAVAALPAGTSIELRLGRAVARAAPAVILGAMSANQRRYLGRLDEAIATLRTLETGGFSHVPAASAALREGLRPLAAIKDQLLSHLRRFGIDAVGKDFRTVVREIFSTLRPSRTLAPLVPLVTAVRDKLRTLLVDGLVTPVRAGVIEVRRVFDELDLTPLREGLDALHAQIRDEISAFRPSVILGDLLTAVESLQARLATYDPLAPIRGTIQALETAIDHIAEAFRPTVLLAPVLATYDRIVALVHNLDVRNLLEPLLDELRDIEAQLDTGLERAGTSFETLQEALP